MCYGDAFSYPSLLFAKQHFPNSENRVCLEKKIKTELTEERREKENKKKENPNPNLT
jgi:hypothetical protein